MLAPRRSGRLSIQVNGAKVAAELGESVLGVCDRAGIPIPRLCYHPCLPTQGSCGACVVEVTDAKGKTRLANACVTKVSDDLVVKTTGDKVTAKLVTSLTNLLKKHDDRCSSCTANERCEFRPVIFAAGVTNTKRVEPAVDALDNSSLAIKIDPGKCIACGRCVRACKTITGLALLKVVKGALATTTGTDLAQTDCIACGQCTLYCPTGGIVEKTEFRTVLAALREHSKPTVAVVSPAVATGLGVSVGQLVASLKALGFDYVFNSAIGETDYLNSVLKEIGAGKPLVTSTCPAFVAWAKKKLPDVKLLGVPTPADQFWPKLDEFLGGKPAFVVEVTNCLAAKGRNGPKATTLGARELKQLLKTTGVIPRQLAGTQFDAPFAGSGSTIGFAGGLSEAVLSKIHQDAQAIVTPSFLRFLKLHDQAILTCEVNGKPLKVISVTGIANVAKVLAKLKKGDKDIADAALIEVNACPGGCVAGGGGIKPVSAAEVAKRIAKARSG